MDTNQMNALAPFILFTTMYDTQGNAVKWMQVSENIDDT